MQISDAELASESNRGEPMPRRAIPTTAEGKIADVIRWADRQGFDNIAAELRQALALLPPSEPPAARAKRRAR
jgi:hypothetical protein